MTEEALKAAVDYLVIVSFILSLFITAFVFYRYRKVRSLHLLIWTVAWAITALRTILSLFTFESDAAAYTLAVLIVLHSILWYVGMAHLLEYRPVWRIWFPAIFMIFHVATAGYIYLLLGCQPLGSFLTYVIFVPAILLVLSFCFYGPARSRNRLGLSIVSGAFLLWGLDFLIFGYFFYGLENQNAGLIGWLIGVFFRIMILVGFYYMVEELKPAEKDARSGGR